jgi:hypothetical protein
VRAQDALRARLAEFLHLLAELARTGTSRATPTVTRNDVDAWRRRISLKVADVQGLIESSKFELGDVNPSEIQKLTGDAQIILILLLSLARQRDDPTRLPEAARAAAVDLDIAVAAALETLATHGAVGSEPAALELEDTLNAFTRSLACKDGLNEGTAHLAGRLALYRTLVAAIKRFSLEPASVWHDGHRRLSSNGEGSLRAG